MKGLKNKKIAVAMSGGVDSSVVACLLKQEGYDIAGFTMVQYDDEEFGYSPEEGSLAASNDAQKICRQLDIKHIVINVKDQFRRIVLNDFVNQYKRGYTPNPCTLCNPTIKWGAFFDKIQEYGFEYFATGHYVKLVQGQDRPHIYRADNSKDQTYMLWRVRKEQLEKTIFPLYNLDKEQVRKIAGENNLHVAEKKDSQEICFIKDHYLDFVNKIVPAKPGKIKLLSGEVIGEHQGLTAYTIGQRKGLHTKLNVTLYVHSMDITKNILYATADREDLKVASFRINELHFLETDPHLIKKSLVQIRYNSHPVQVRDFILEGKEALVILEEAIESVTPGQSAVFYSEEEELLGGGVIVK
ncbi:tRNA 2-thiouridine(34) synthase MnmA [bacterium]|nr:tRNA 2-thiouridine(34) synthase MnmA [bacterium]